ncbi:translesion DNA synthesis-associated protein ImuA [Pseudomonas sp. NPDC089554]|uniref:translesion DNA synthesis-associated protein ImuA n=1 Tax=Pseudomonas sp. NPDC089554 TaxID=3390653 RepID=UPI003D080779
MGAVVDLDGLLEQRRVWRGRQAQARPLGLQPTGHEALDARLPEGGWPAAALSELLLAGPGCGELHLLWPSLARLTAQQGRVVLVAPPFLPYAPAWQAAGVDLGWLVQIEAEPGEALWAAEQCLRSGSCAAVLCWPERADDRALRRLQVAAETGQALAFACRPQQAAHNPSPAALRIAIDACPAQWRVLKCRGGLAPANPIACPGWE